MNFRHWLAGTLLVALDRGFEIGVTAMTDLVRGLCEHNALVMAVVFMGAGVALSVLVTHAAHKCAERHELQVSSARSQAH